VAGFRVGRKKNAEDAQLHTWVHQAQSGDTTARNEVLRAYGPFILRVASTAAKRYIHKESDDEYSIALLAMNEAIDGFDANRNASFLNFAETVIQRRLIDYFRSQQGNRRATVWSDFEVQDDEDNTVNYAEVESAVAAHVKEMERGDRASEIAEYSQALADFGLSFQELTEIAPKHRDARASAIEVARTIVANSDLLQFVLERKSLPLKALHDRTPVSRKTLERQRKYILAIVVLMCGEFDYLSAYIS